MKCGKILESSNPNKPGIILCKHIPCPNYVLLGIKYRECDLSNVPRNPCAWSFEVLPFLVIQGAIEWSGQCIQIDSKAGIVYEGILTVGSYPHEVIIYNMIGCFMYESDFEQVFWSGCGIQPSPEYPDIWVNNQVTQTALNCIQNYWNSEFTKNFLLNYNLIKIDMYQNWVVGARQRYEYIYHKICYGEDCPGDYEPDPPSAACSPDCPEYEEWWDIGEVKDAGCFATKRNSNGDEVYSFYLPTASAWQIPCQDYPAPSCWIDDCCFYNELYENFDAANEVFFDHINDPDQYLQGGTSTDTCVNSTNLCHTFTYSSIPWSNAYAPEPDVSYSVNWKKLRLTKTSSTPSGVTGIRFAYKIVESKNNLGLRPQTHTVTETSGFIELSFNEDYEELPLANYLNGIECIQYYSCQDDCDWESWELARFQPMVNWDWWPGAFYENDAYSHDVTVSLSGIEYIK